MLRPARAGTKGLGDRGPDVSGELNGQTPARAGALPHRDQGLTLGPKWSGPLDGPRGSATDRRGGQK
jgi:hypothetical protein